MVDPRSPPPPEISLVWKTAFSKFGPSVFVWGGSTSSTKEGKWLQKPSFWKFLEKGVSFFLFFPEFHDGGPLK